MIEETVFYSDAVSPGLSLGSLIGLVLLGCVAVILIILGILWLKRKLSRPELYGMTREQVQKRWKQVRETSQKQGDMGMKLAIIEADNLLDGALKSLVIPGDTLGERLKAACYNHPKLKDVWWAHKLRNNLVHDHSFHLRASEGRRALDEFEKALKVLNIF